MKKLYVDNNQEILNWCNVNISKNNFEVYTYNITIYCKDKIQRKHFLVEITRL